MPGDAPHAALRRRNAAAIVLALFASLSMVGYAVGSTPMRGIGAASAMSPLPKVFSDVDGLETFASEFTLHYERAGVGHELPVTPAVYARLGGPYNRRNVYGAALSYAPRLPEPLWRTVYCHGMAPEGPLRRELGFAATDSRFAFAIRTRTRGRDDAWMYAPECP